MYHSLNKTTINHKNDFFSELRNCVVFIPNENQQEIIDFIHANSENINQRFKRIFRKFFLSSDIIFQPSLPKQIKYRFPILNNIDFSEIEIQSINSYFGVPNSKSGLLIINSFDSEFLEFNFTDINLFNQLIDSYINHIEDIYFNIDYLPSSGGGNSDENIKLDEETEKKVEDILNQLSDLKDKGTLFKILPIIEKFVKENNTDIDDLSELILDENYTILLQNYDIEIKLSHLTKSVYILFLRNLDGILLSDLHRYKDELTEIYKEVSNREDYHKMIASIDDIIDTKTNAIYVHLSRIKSAFTKVLHPEIAKRYYVYGDKFKPKKINLDRNLITDTPQLIRASKKL